MAGVDIPELSSVKFRQLAIQEGNLRLNKQQIAEAEQDRQFKGNLSLLSMNEMPIPTRIAAGNAILKQMKMPGSISEDGLAPFTALMKKMSVDQTKGADLSIYQPAIESLWKNNLILPSELPDASKALQGIESQAAEQTTRLALKPELDRLTTARNWWDANASRVKLAEERLKPGAAVQIVAGQMSQEEAAQVTNEAQVYKATLDREKLLDDKKTFYLRAFRNPALRKAFETGKVLTETGTAIDDNTIKARALSIIEKGGPEDEAEQRWFDAAAPLAFPNQPRLQELKLNEQIQRNQRQQQASKVAQTLVTQNAYISRVNELEQKLEAARAKRKAGNLTPDEIAGIATEEGELNNAIGDAQLASFRDAEQAGEQFAALREDLTAQIEATKRQLARVPIAQTVALKQDIRSLEGDAKFYDALNTKLLLNHPTKQAELTQQAYLMEQEGEKGQAAQLRTRVGEMKREWASLSEQVNAHAQSVLARGSQLNAAMARMNKDTIKEKATNDLVKYVLLHQGEDGGLTAAFPNGLTLYADADSGKAYDTIRKILEDEGELMLFSAQAAFAARQEATGGKETVKQSLAAIGRQFPKVNLKDVRESIEKSPLVSVTLGKEVDKEIGQQMTESRNAALGAVETVDAANRIDQALTSGAVSLGPTATIRNKIDQVSQLVGVGGKDVTERLVNTRNVIRGLAQFAISARKALKGQGQVSDFEGRLLLRAEAGEIDDMTMPELKSFIGVTRKLATRQYQQHQMNLERFRATPDMQNRVPFFEVPPLPEPGGQGGFSIKESGGWGIKRK